MNAVLDSVLRDLGDRMVKNADDYRELVRQLAHDEPIDLDDVPIILQGADKTLETMTADVVALQHKIHLEKLIAAADALMPERLNLLDEIAAADKTLAAAKVAAERAIEKAQMQHDQAVMPLNSRIGEIDKYVDNRQFAINELNEIAMATPEHQAKVAALKIKIEEISKELPDVDKRRQEFLEMARRCNDIKTDREYHAAQAMTREDEKAYLVEAENAVKRRDGYREKANALKARFDDLQSQRSTLNAEMFVP